MGGRRDWEDAVNQAASETTPKDGVPSNVWYDDGYSSGFHGMVSMPGAPTADVKVFKSPEEIAGRVLGLSAMPGAFTNANSPYWQMVEDLYKTGALYDLRYGTNVNSVATAAERSIKQYANSPYATSMSYNEWLARASAVSDRGDDKKNGSGGAGGPRAFTNTTVQLTNETDARALVDNALNQYLGRDANDQEREKFWKQLNKQQAKNPNVSKGVAGPGGTNAVQSGGFNTATFAEDFAKSRDDYAETQASTTVLDWMKESLMKDQTEGLM